MFRNLFSKKPSVTFGILQASMKSWVPPELMTMKHDYILIHGPKRNWAQVSIDDSGTVIYIQYYLSCYPHVASRIAYHLSQIAPLIISDTLLHDKHLRGL